MKKNVCKWLSAALAVVMTVALLPMGGITVTADIASDTNLVTNGDFEATGTHWQTGLPQPDVYWTKYQSTKCVAEAAYSGNHGMHLIGNGGWGALMVGTVAVDPGCTYTLTFKYKVNTSYMNFKISGDTSGTSYAYKGSSVTTDWATYTTTFTVLNDSTVTFAFSGAGNSVAESIYVDDFVMVRTHKAVTNLIDNGGFETGDTTGWVTNTAGSTNTISTDVVNSGSYSLLTNQTNGNYAAAVSYDNITVKANTNYILAFWYNYATTPTKYYRAFVYGRDTATSITTYNTSATYTGSWGLAYIPFNSGDNTTILFKLATTSVVAGASCYIDDLMLIEAPVVPNGDFELGSTAWKVYQSTVVDETAAYEGTLGAHLQGASADWGGVLKQALSGLESGADYNITFWYKAVQQGVNWKLTGDTTTTKFGGGYLNKKDWTMVSKDFTADDTSATLLFNCSGIDTTKEGYEAGIDEVYVDSIIITKYVDPKDPTTDGFIINGDFETGDLSNWRVSSNYATASKEAAKNSNFGAYIQNPGNWSGLISQTMASVEEGKAYRFSLDYRAITNGVNFKVVNGNATVAAQYLDKRVWTHTEKIFRATGPNLEITFVGAGNGVDTNVFVDNILIEEIPDDEVDIFTYDGKSAMEMNGNLANEEDGKGGLAFKYTVAMNNAVVAAGNHSVEGSAGMIYQQNSAIAHPFTNDEYSTPYDYKVVEVGAIVSREYSNKDDLTLTNVNGTKTIQIKGEKRWDVGADYYSYVVRVRNIPEAFWGDEIYVRAYAIVETANGTRQVTLYDDIMAHGNYDATIQGNVPQPE